MNTILVVDDDMLLGEALRDVLSESGDSVLLSFDAYSGFQMARDRRPDLIILDLKLPAGSGESVFQRLSSDPVTSGIPVVFMSSLAPEIIEAQFPSAAKGRLIRKPLDIVQVKKTVEAVLRP